MTYGTVNADTLVTSTSGGILGAGNASIMKNRIINGAMVIDQRNAGASVTPTTDGQYTLDRMQALLAQSSKFSVQQNAGSVTPPVGFLNYLGSTSLSAYTVGANEYFGIAQLIEGFNIADLGWGTANAKTVTLSFWSYSSLTGTFGGTVANTAQDRSYPFSYTISSANTWEYKTITIAGETTGTWGTGNSIGIRLRFSLGAGSSKLGTANAWASANYFAPTGATNVVSTNAATFYITGVQLEVGSSATGFEYVNYQTSLANCQRYYIKYSGSGYRFYGGRTESTAAAIWQCALPVEMRTVPTVTAIDVTNLAINDSSVQVACTSISTAYSSTRQIAQGFNCGTVTNMRYIFLTPTSATAAVEASAEL